MSRCTPEKKTAGSQRLKQKTIKFCKANDPRLDQSGRNRTAEKEINLRDNLQKKE